MPRSFATTEAGNLAPPWSPFRLTAAAARTLGLLALLLAGCRPQEATVSLALLGDIVLGRGVAPTQESFAYIQPELLSADLALANLESPLAADIPAEGYGYPGEVGRGYNLCAPAGHAPLLAAWGLDLVSLANNHRLDCGPQGLAETELLLADAGVLTIADGGDAVSVEVDGLELAFLAFDDVSQPVDLAAATQAIQALRAGGAIVIVSIHWGLEYQAGPSARQRLLAEEFSQAGAALIWGHHPHVLQPSEWIDTPAGRALVLYSLGNALFDQGGLEDMRQSALLIVAVGRDGVRSVEAVPFVIDLQSSRLLAPDPQTAAEISDRLRLP
ncbi:MAG: CapA family protein [Chloroflexota bacterium]